MFNWKVSIRWYAAALLIFPALLVPIIYSFALFSSNYCPGLLIGTGIAAGLIGGFLEEIGWTGFALPKNSIKIIYPLLQQLFLDLFMRFGIYRLITSAGSAFIKDTMFYIFCYGLLL